MQPSGVQLRDGERSGRRSVLFRSSKSPAKDHDRDEHANRMARMLPWSNSIRSSLSWTIGIHIPL